MLSGDFAAAKRGAEAVLKRDPNSIDGHTYLAIALENSGEAAGAGAHYLRAIELAPANGAALNNYGAWLCGQGRAAESLSWFDKAVAEPGYGNKAMALANAGVCAGQAGQQERADRDLRQRHRARSESTRQPWEPWPSGVPRRSRVRGASVFGAASGRCTSESAGVAACVTN